MASISRQFTGLLQIPNGPLVVDWANPVTNGLVGAWIPGVMNVVNLARPSFGLAYASAGAFATGMTPEGPGLLSNAANAGICSASPTEFLAAGQTKLSCYWRGMVLGAPVNFGEYFGVTANNTAAPPYVLFSFQSRATDIFFALGGSVSGFYTTFITGAMTTGIKSLAATVNTSASSERVFYNGVFTDNNVNNDALATPGATSEVFIGISGTPSTARYSNSITLAAYVWKRTLTDIEVAQIEQAPYAFLIPAEYELPILQSIALAPTSVFRKTASRIGTRVGTRQTWAA